MLEHTNAESIYTIAFCLHLEWNTAARYRWLGRFRVIGSNSKIMTVHWHEKMIDPKWHIGQTTLQDLIVDVSDGYRLYMARVSFYILISVFFPPKRFLTDKRFVIVSNNPEYAPQWNRLRCPKSAIIKQVIRPKINCGNYHRVQSFNFLSSEFPTYHWICIINRVILSVIIVVKFI